MTVFPKPNCWAKRTSETTGRQHTCPHTVFVGRYSGSSILVEIQHHPDFGPSHDRGAVPASAEIGVAGCVPKNSSIMHVPVTTVKIVRKAWECFGQVKSHRSIVSIDKWPLTSHILYRLQKCHQGRLPRQTSRSACDEYPLD